MISKREGCTPIRGEHVGFFKHTIHSLLPTHCNLQCFLYFGIGNYVYACTYELRIVSLGRHIIDLV